MSYNGKQYIAKVANRGMTPTVSTYYWALHNCTTTTTTTTSTSTVTASTWVQGQYYAAGSIVSYNGKLYVAKYANPGYNPTISTYYWAPYSG